MNSLSEQRRQTGLLSGWSLQGKTLQRKERCAVRRGPNQRDAPLGSLTKAWAVTTQCETLSDPTHSACCRVGSWTKLKEVTECLEPPDLWAITVQGLHWASFTFKWDATSPTLKVGITAQSEKPCPQITRSTLTCPFSPLKYHCNDRSFF